MKGINLLDGMGLGGFNVRGGMGGIGCDGFRERTGKFLLQLWIWYSFPGGECSALFRCGYCGTELGGCWRGTWPPEDLVRILLLALT